MIWIQTILLQYIRAVFIRLPVIGAYSDMMITAVYLALIVLSIPCYKIWRQDLAFIFIVVLVFALEWALYEDASQYLERYMVDFLVKTLPLYFVGVSLALFENKEKIIDQLYNLSMLSLVGNLVYKYAFGSAMTATASLYEGDMDLAYKLLPHCCMIAYYAVKKTNMLNVMLTVIGGLYLFMLGTRGAALIYLASIAFNLIKGRRSRGMTARIVVIFGGIGTFIASPLYEASLLWLYQRAQQFGLSVRIFDKILSGTQLASSGRDQISETLFDAIQKSPILGNGICSDRVVAGNYAHNIAIELWMEFGVIIGTGILIAIVSILIHGYLSTREEGEKGLIQSLIAASFLKLFLSSSYLNERLLFFLLGICVGSIRRGRFHQ